MATPPMLPTTSLPVSSELVRIALDKGGHEGSNGAREPKRFPLVAVCDVPEIVEQSWLVEGLIPTFEEGAAGYVFGPPKARKSLLLLELGICVAAGVPVMGRFEVKRGGTSVGFFAEDQKAETSRRGHRIARAKGIKMPRNLYLVDVPSLALDNKAHQQMLLETLRSVPNLAFVWLDPMVRLHTLNDNRAEELGPLHTFLRTLSRALPGAVIVLAHHTNHGGAARGSTDYTAFGDFNLYLESPDDLTTRVRKIENRGGPPGAPFSYTVEDSAEAGGAGMKLVVDDRDPEESDEDRGDVVTTMVVGFKDSHPGMSGKEAIRRLRATGMKFDTRKFWSIWKGDGS